MVPPIQSLGTAEEGTLLHQLGTAKVKKYTKSHHNQYGILQQFYNTVHLFFINNVNPFFVQFAFLSPEFDFLSPSPDFPSDLDSNRF